MKKAASLSQGELLVRGTGAALGSAGCCADIKAIVPSAGRAETGLETKRLSEVVPSEILGLEDVGGVANGRKLAGNVASFSEFFILIYMGNSLYSYNKEIYFKLLKKSLKLMFKP